MGGSMRRKRKSGSMRTSSLGAAVRSIFSSIRTTTEAVMRSLFPRVSIMVAVISVLTCQVLLAQAYPTKPIQLINTSAEGGAGAFVARLMAEKLVPVLG